MAQYRTIRTATGPTSAAQIDEGLRAHMNKVYGTMSVGMLLTFAVAWAVGTSPELLSVFRDPATLQPNILGWIVMFAPLIMAFAFGAILNRISAAAAQLFFFGFAAVMGLSLSSIFLVYTGTSIAQTFFATAAAFAGLSLWGYTTKKDLSGFGTFLIMGVVGLLVASLINLFLRSSAMDLVISFLGVLLFAGLTAYDTQKIKSIYAHVAGTDMMGKSVIMGALNLYLDFINMFLFLLRIMGSQRS